MRQKTVYVETPERVQFSKLPMRQKTASVAM